MRRDEHAEETGGAPETIPFVVTGGQPRPIVVRVSRIPAGGRVVTAIYRGWAEGDMARCRLCAAGCRGHDDGCLVQVDLDVPYAAAAMLRDDGMTWIDAGKAAVTGLSS